MTLRVIVNTAIALKKFRRLSAQIPCRYLFISAFCEYGVFLYLSGNWHEQALKYKTLKQNFLLRTCQIKYFGLALLKLKQLRQGFFPQVTTKVSRMFLLLQNGPLMYRTCTAVMCFSGHLIYSCIPFFTALVYAITELFLWLFFHAFCNLYLYLGTRCWRLGCWIRTDPVGC